MGGWDAAALAVAVAGTFEGHQSVQHVRGLCGGEGGSVYVCVGGRPVVSGVPLTSTRWCIWGPLKHATSACLVWVWERFVCVCHAHIHAHILVHFHLYARTCT
jgi:hypothetical protein